MNKLLQNSKENSNPDRSELGKRRPIDVYSTEIGVSEAMRSSALGAVAVMAGLVKPIIDKIHPSDSTSHDVEQRAAVEFYMTAVQRVGKSRFAFRNTRFEKKAQLAELELASVAIELDP